MTDKQKILIDELINDLPDIDKAVYKEIAENALNLGLKVTKTQRALSYTLNFSTKNQTIMRIGIDNDRQTEFKLKFYANKEYPQKFHDAVKADYKDCYNCGKCERKNLRCYITDVDGKTVRCGFELVNFGKNIITKDDIKEISKLVSVQSKFAETF